MSKIFCKYIDKEFALYVGYNCQRQCELARELSKMGIRLHEEATIEAATARLHGQVYSLSLIQFEDVSKQVFDFFTLFRSKNSTSITIVLIDKPQNNIEKELFDHGVDDVVPGKQLCVLALTSRIKRRLYSGKLLWTQTNKIMLKGGALINFNSGEVRLNGKVSMLSRLHEKLLRYFLSNPNRVITRDEMLKSDIWDMAVARAGSEEAGKAFDMAISRLRRAIEVSPQNPQIIKTVYGKGWMLARDAVL